MGFIDPEYPPRNRREQSLPVLHIEIEDGNGVHVLDPNSLIMAEVSGSLRNMLRQPVADSMLSGHPGYLFREDDVELALAPDELSRLIRRNLKPGEYLTLRDRFGIFFSIHDDFYEPETGEALQPKGTDPGPEPDDGGPSAA